ncbi:MAG: hypothetical protein JWQ79_2204 [Mucilaginibacter sp.]|nr:hypothetical protein [Mucilaginibacter sp.]
MNWKIIFQLSLFGLIMAFATISLIPEKIEPAFWLVIFVFCAYVIAKVCSGKYFLHGFLVSIINCIWITAAHIFFYDSYAAHHPDMAAMYTGIHPRQMMLVYGPAFGIMFGIILGLFSFVASKLVKKTPQ